MLTEQQRTERRLGIGGSDVAVILGLSNYKTPYQLFLEKRGLLEEDGEMSLTPAAYWGNRLESIIRDEFALRNKVDIAEPETIVHPFYDFMRANVDGYIPEWDAILEVKCSSSWMRDEWGEPGSDVIPMAYLVQVAHYCIVTNASCAHIALLLGGNDYREYKYVRDEALEATVLKACSDFWECVQNDEAPAPTNTIDLRLMFPKSDPSKILQITPEVDAQFAMMNMYKKKIKELEPKLEEHRFNIMKYLGEAESLTDSDGKVLATYKTAKNGVRSFKLKEAKE